MLERKLREIFAANATVKIASSGGPVSPWVATAYYAEHGLFEIDVMVEATGKTLRNMIVDARVGLMLETGNPMKPFAQAEGRARIEAAERGIVFDEIVGKTPDSRPLMSIPTLVPVRIRVERWLITDVPAGWLPARELRNPTSSVPSPEPTLDEAVF